MSYQKLQNCYISIIGDCTITKKRKVTALIFLSSFSRVILELRLKQKNHNFYFRLWLIVFYFYMDLLFIVGRIYNKQKLSNFFFFCGTRFCVFLTKKKK